MKKLLIFGLALFGTLSAEELKIKADYFESDQAKQIAIFRGHVNIKKRNDEINATKVTVFTDKQRHPIKFIAVGNVSFKIKDEQGKRYTGKAQKAIYLPNKKEYRLYNNVHLHQLGEKKEIIGDEVVFNAATGKSRARSAKNNPVMMIFDLNEKPKKAPNKKKKK